MISFGANLGQPAVTINQAAHQLQSLLAGKLQDFQISRLFRTPAVGGPTGQPPFMNAVAALNLIDCSPWDVWHVVREVEQALGRVRQERWEARRIDLDVLLFDDQCIWTQHFKLPHPRMVMRRFILEPALDVAAHWQEPVSGMRLDRLAQGLRRGPASIALVSHDLHRDQGLLEAAAATSQCQWITPQLVALSKHEKTDQTVPPVGLQPDQAPTTGRWLGLVPASQLQDLRYEDASQWSILPAAKMLFLLASPIERSGAAWEDIHRESAQWLGLSVGPSDRQWSVNRWPLAGPRYMLSTDDLVWAQHEIVAALEAMDCPVEAMDALP
ncbi:MAG: 2-amino-4-hydroxy-6-hydroxymethyldihydropteridine diphosphokinase [Pirellulaceae bacterium]|nr:2-amino-4-hydroxy-6-hydroxymethyldihydropteridine diphosphokinase [Pirellulaceae bacterium]